ncbi:MAG TPA: gluconokinase, partial [Actinoplanes sp.]|nr:gluconokinase [Actinoplanes sp.]
MSGEVVLGVDIGTTSTKVVAYDTSGQARQRHSAGYPLREPHRGHAEQDPQEILAAVLESVRAVTAALDGPVAGLSFSSAMHTLIGLDAGSRPLTASLSWADSRSREQAERLRASAGGLALHRRTGTPVHPMAPLPKLVWFREQQPEVFAQAATWLGIKDYVVLRMCDALVTDHSLASGSGLMDIHRLDWDPEALQTAGITVDQLPELRPTTHVLPGLSPATAEATGLPAGTPVVLGAGDGPLASLGLGAVDPGVAACSVDRESAQLSDAVSGREPASSPISVCIAELKDSPATGPSRAAVTA